MRRNEETSDRHMLLSPLKRLSGATDRHMLLSPLKRLTGAADRHMLLSPLKRLTGATDRHAWLSLTPEPEGELPRAIAALRAGDQPSAAAVAAERERVERLVLRGRRRGWRRWLAETRALAHRAADRQPREADIALDVIDNHDALCLGLAPRGRGPGRGRGTR